jgi:ureidoacrylate peracid hydrolase
MEAELRFPSALEAAVCALVVVDVQNDFCHPSGLEGRAMDPEVVRAMCSAITTLRGAASEAGVPVIFVQTVHREATDSRAWARRLPPQNRAICREGSWGAEFHECEPEQADVVVQKHRYSAFHGTELGHVLRTFCRTTVVLTGTATNVCVESTARDACMLDYDVVLVADGTCAADGAEHAGALHNVRNYFGDVVDTATIVTAWRRDTSAAG